LCSQDSARAQYTPKTHYTPTSPLVLEALEHQAEALAGTFKAQEVANPLWAYATMGREPGAG